MSLALPFQTAKQLAAAVRKKKIGCLELLDLYLKRVEAYNPELNAIIATDIEGARKRARAADKAVKEGKKLGPLHGVPMTIKELFDVAGLPTTWGDPAFKDTLARQNALVAQRMVNAGVTLFGKTNVPLNLADWQSYNEVYGSTNNPWDLSRTPGGSSGGSGAALAAGLTGIEAGSDIGASIRNPAHYCGVWGHKPTWGVVCPKGHALDGQRRLRPTSAWSVRWRAAPRISRSPWTSWPGPTRSTAAAGRSPCRARRKRSCATSRWRCCCPIPMPRSTIRCSPRSRSSPTSSARRRPR